MIRLRFLWQDMKFLILELELLDGRLEIS